MVSIIINESKNNSNMNDEEVMSLLKDISKENSELKELINSLNDNVSTLVNIVNSLRKTEEDDASQSTVEVKDIIKDLNKLEKKTINHKSKSNSNNPYRPNKHLRKEWKKISLLDDGSIINEGRRVFKLPISLNELLYLIEVEKTLTFKTAKELREKLNIPTATFGKIIYNLRETNNFDNVLLKYKSNLRKVHFKVNDDDFICVNKKNTNIKVSLARDWINILANTDKKQTKILEFQEAHKDIDKHMIRIVCDSYNNPKLTNLLKNKVTHFIENNPSKRKNLIANGGLL